MTRFAKVLISLLEQKIKDVPSLRETQNLMLKSVEVQILFKAKEFVRSYISSVQKSARSMIKTSPKMMKIVNI